MHNPLISVIIPVYNVERYLAICLDSVLTQSYRNLEIIVINDGSTDYSLKIAQQYAQVEDRITVYSFENGGLSEARNRGLEVATGDYVTFVDSDDLLLPGALEIMFNTLYETNADVVEGAIIKGDHVKKFENPDPLTIQEYTFKEAVTDVLYQKSLLPSAWGKLYRMDLFKDLRFEKGLYYEDLDLFYKVYEKIIKLVRINYPVYFYRQTEGSILNSWNSKRLDVLKVTENLEKYIQSKYPDLLPAAKDRRLSANFNMFALCSLHGNREEAKQCWEHIRKNRKESLLNSNVRMKNKAGILLSYFGRPVFNLVARRIYNK